MCLSQLNDSFTLYLVLSDTGWGYSFGYASVVLFVCLLVCLIGAGIDCFQYILKCI